MSGVYISEAVKGELDHFKRLHEHFAINLGKNTVKVKDADEKLLYMMLSASYAMDIFEDGFFDNFVITDKQLTGRQEMQLDAYAFIETDDPKEKHLHLFQYKLHETDKHGASPVEVNNFVSTINNTFVHSEFRTGTELQNPVFNEIDKLVNNFINGRRMSKVEVKCHFITNAHGIDKRDRKNFDPIFGRFEYDKQNFGFDLQVYGEKEILELIQEGKIKVDKETLEIAIDTQNPYPYRFEDNTKKEDLGLPGKVLIGVCNVNELIRLQNKYHHNQLYSENIRLYLGDRAAVNKNIIQTITADESQWFQYMNNGITIICDKMDIGAINNKKNTRPIELTNLQIINGCQTVNALYSAKYGDNTKDNFKPSNVLIKIHQINPANQRFKTSVIKATNNQNSVKTYSLVSNDPIQVEIQSVLKRLGFLYNRKGESKQTKPARITEIVDMVQAALAYRAVFEFSAQQLRARIGQSRVFQNKHYEETYNVEYLENPDKSDLYLLCARLLTGSLILDQIRDLINEFAGKYVDKLPIIRKSTYYLAGLYYAVNKKDCDKFIDECTELIKENNQAKIKNIKLFENFNRHIKDGFDSLVEIYRDFYKGNDANKTDIDNLLKNNIFGNGYTRLVRKYIDQHTL